MYDMSLLTLSLTKEKISRLIAATFLSIGRAATRMRILHGCHRRRQVENTS